MDYTAEEVEADAIELFGGPFDGTSTVIASGALRLAIPSQSRCFVRVYYVRRFPIRDDGVWNFDFEPGVEG